MRKLFVLATVLLSLLVAVPSAIADESCTSEARLSFSSGKPKAVAVTSCTAAHTGTWATAWLYRITDQDVILVGSSTKSSGGIAVSSIQASYTRSQVCGAGTTWYAAATGGTDGIPYPYHDTDPDVSAVKTC